MSHVVALKNSQPVYKGQQREHEAVDLYRKVQIICTIH